jgi:hypothetical protein
MIYWHYFRIIRFYLFNVTCIVLYIFGPVATHGHAPSSFKRNKLTSRIGLQNFLFLRDLPFQFVQPPRSNRWVPGNHRPLPPAALRPSPRGCRCRPATPAMRSLRCRHRICRAGPVVSRRLADCDAGSYCHGEERPWGGMSGPEPEEVGTTPLSSSTPSCTPLWAPADPTDWLSVRLGLQYVNWSTSEKLNFSMDTTWKAAMASADIEGSDGEGFEGSWLTKNGIP